MTRKLYSAMRSGHAHTVRTLLSILKVDYETVELAATDGETRREAFRAINAFGQIPVFDDDGFVVRDSHAILFYLAQKYDPARTWLPTAVETSTRVQEWIATSTLDLVIGCAWARAGTQFRRAVDVPAAQRRARRMLKIVDDHLAKREWLAADHPTIADLSMYSYIRVAPEGGIETDGYGNIGAWLSRIERLEGHLPMQRFRAEP